MTTVEICAWEDAKYNHKKLQRKWNVEVIIIRPQDITIMELGHTFMLEKEASHANYMDYLTQNIEQAQREIEEIREANDTFRQKMAISRAKGEVL